MRDWRRSKLHNCVADGEGKTVLAAAARIRVGGIGDGRIKRDLVNTASRAGVDYLGTRRDFPLERRRVSPGGHDDVGLLRRFPADPKQRTRPSSGQPAAIHVEDGVGILDVLLERRPPFPPGGPVAVVAEFCDALKAYGLYEVMGDRYAAGFNGRRIRDRCGNCRPIPMPQPQGLPHRRGQ